MGIRILYQFIKLLKKAPVKRSRAGGMARRIIKTSDKMLKRNFKMHNGSRRGPGKIRAFGKRIFFLFQLQNENSQTITKVFEFSSSFTPNGSSGASFFLPGRASVNERKTQKEFDLEECFWCERGGLFPFMKTSISFIKSPGNEKTKGAEKVRTGWVRDEKGFYKSGETSCPIVVLCERTVANKRLGETRKTKTAQVKEM